MIDDPSKKHIKKDLLKRSLYDDFNFFIKKWEIPSAIGGINGTNCFIGSTA